jgi:glutamine amidotransferase
VFERGVDTLGQTVREVAAADPAARLNLLATDGTRLLATTWGDTLSVLATEDGVALASEPWDDDPAWTDVPDRQLVEVTPDGVSTTPLED